MLLLFFFYILLDHGYVEYHPILLHDLFLFKGKCFVFCDIDYLCWSCEGDFVNSHVLHQGGTSSWSITGDHIYYTSGKTSLWWVEGSWIWINNLKTVLLSDLIFKITFWIKISYNFWLIIFKIVAKVITKIIQRSFSLLV